MAAPAVEGAAVTALRSVLLRARHAAERAGTQPERVRVVAVSKTKPNSLIRQVYDAGHRCFGENYVQEIVQKAPQLPEDIEWHFIGHLQSNKVKTLLGAVPNLALFEGVDNEKIANHLDRAVSSLGRNPLRVFVQVNTSGEASKSGIEPSDCVRLAEYVKLRCPNLEFSGLMTIGMPDYTSTPENFRVMDSVAFKKEDAGFLQSDNDIKYFVNLIDNVLGHSSISSDEQTLSNCRIEVCEALGITEDECELSMGMSSDFEQAIEMGSTNVRVGSTIFGPRDYSKKLPN